MVLIISLSLLILFISFTLCYFLILAFIGVSKRFKEAVLPILILAAIAYTSRFGFHFPGEINSFISLFSCMILVKAFNREISWMLSILGTFLTFIILVFGGFVWPFFNLMVGAVLTKFEPYSWEGIYLSLLEILLPLLVLILLKVRKISLMKYLEK